MAEIKQIIMINKDILFDKFFSEECDEKMLIKKIQDLHFLMIQLSMACNFEENGDGDLIHKNCYKCAMVEGDKEEALGILIEAYEKVKKQS